MGESVPELDIDRYAGRWYEIYRSAFISTTFERGCDCVIANYTLLEDEKDSTPDAPYSVALVGSVPCRLSLWILARDPNLAEDDERIDALFAIAQEQGYATDRIGMTRTFQGDTCAYF